MIRFKWRRQMGLLPSLLNGTHEFSEGFRFVYLRVLMAEMKARFPLLIPEELEKNPERVNPDWAAARLGRSSIRTPQQNVWMSVLRSKKAILIDTPDYSKTDRRLMAKDLEGDILVVEFPIASNLARR